jgi:hypothetical protein
MVNQHSPPGQIDLHPGKKEKKTNWIINKQLNKKKIKKTHSKEGRAP